MFLRGAGTWNNYHLVLQNCQQWLPPSLSSTAVLVLYPQVKLWSPSVGAAVKGGLLQHYNVIIIRVTQTLLSRVFENYCAKQSPPVSSLLPFAWINKAFSFISATQSPPLTGDTFTFGDLLQSTRWVRSVGSCRANIIRLFALGIVFFCRVQHQAAYYYTLNILY